MVLLVGFLKEVVGTGALVAVRRRINALGIPSARLPNRWKWCGLPFGVAARCQIKMPLQMGRREAALVRLWVCGSVQPSKKQSHAYLWPGLVGFGQSVSGFGQEAEKSCDDRCFRICSFQFSWQGESYAV